MKTSGILMPIFSLPSPYGIGTIGKSAFDFANYVSSCGAEIWQVLPLGPTGYGDSPYQSFSSFAGNPYFIDPNFLCRDGFLKKSDLPEKSSGGKIDYGTVFSSRTKMLKKAYEYSYDRIQNEVSAFALSHPDIKNYAVFMAIKETHGLCSWHDFPKGLRLHKKADVEAFEKTHLGEINYHLFVQYLFFKYWKELKNYVNSLGIRLLGDMPIYVAPDSADVWANHKNFQLDSDRRPTLVAGVPPDYFSADGQKWGNPLYNWQYLKSHGYDFWIRRMRAASELFDTVRLDHFIGFANYYSTREDAPTARDGFWRDGPGMPLFRAIKKACPSLELVAEDLGVVSDKVIRLVKQSKFPAMRVLQFAFGGDDANIHLPENFSHNVVLYTGTHDNATTLAWWDALPEREKAYCARRIGKKSPKMPRDLIAFALKSQADTVIIPIWDILSLGKDCRVNTPGTSKDNWTWRLEKIPGKHYGLSRG